MDGDVVKRRRNLPHWSLRGATYYITFRIRAGELAMGERDLVLQHIRAGDGRFDDLLAVVVMPDDVHVLLRPLEPYEIERILKGIKGASARQINAARGTTGSLWQDESWDRIMRDADGFDEKLRYMLNNPAAAGLIEDGWDWPWWYVATDPQER